MFSANGVDNPSLASAHHPCFAHASHPPPVLGSFLLLSRMSRPFSPVRLTCFDDDDGPEDMVGNRDGSAGESGKECLRKSLLRMPTCFQKFKKGVAGLETCSHEIAMYVRPLASRRVAPCLWLLATYIEKREPSKNKNTARNISQSRDVVEQCVRP